MTNTKIKFTDDAGRARAGWIVERLGDHVLVQVEGEGGLCVPVPVARINNHRCEGCGA